MLRLYTCSISQPLSKLTNGNFDSIVCRNIAQVHHFRQDLCITSGPEEEELVTSYKTEPSTVTHNCSVQKATEY